MDHGPFVSSTIALDPQSTRSIMVHKGIAVRLGARRNAAMVFDPDLLRMAAGWTGGLLHWYPGRDGYQEWPSPEGFVGFTTPQRPGWSVDGKFGDPRTWKYGPLPKKMGQYHGFYLHGERVVFSYAVGEREILESGDFNRVEGEPIFTRAFNVEAADSPLFLHVLKVPEGSGTAMSAEDGIIALVVGGQTQVVGYSGLAEGPQWRMDDRQLGLEIPPSSSDTAFSISIGPVRSKQDADYMKTHLARSNESMDLVGWTEPGPKRWKVLETELRTGAGDGPFVVDELTLPLPNPWNSFLRFSAVDFMSDGRIVVSSMSGEVWIVSGLNDETGKLRWTRFATGLNQPLGVKVVDDVIYVTGRDQITRLHDRDGNGEADYYENFNNEVMAATNFHAFTMNLETDSRGNFYFAKATPWPPERNGVKSEITPHHGVLFRMPPDGSKLEVVARGLRNPNGMSIGPQDEILYSDNEGNWVPTSKVHRIKRDGFHGFIPTAHQREKPTDFEKPILWVPHSVDNSPAAPIFIESETWPDALQGQALLASYGRGTLSLVLIEEADDQWQGAHLKLPLQFRSGLLRGRFNPQGDLIMAGLTSWQSVGHGGDSGSLHRVRYTGQPLHMPVAVDTRKGALELRFSEPLDPAVATELANYSLSQWSYPWTSQYGTRGKVYSVDRPGELGPDQVVVESVSLSADGKTVILQIPSLRQSLVSRTLGVIDDLPDMMETSMGLVMAIDYRLRAASGAAMEHVIHKTIHRVPGDDAIEEPYLTVHQVYEPAPPRIAEVRRIEIDQERKPVSGARVVELRSTGITLSYDVTEIRAKAGERLRIRFVNASDMVHNLVLVKAEADIHPIGIAAIAVPADELVLQEFADRILAASKLAYPGDTVELEFMVPAPGSYPYICTFSGHFTMMQGRLLVAP